MDITKAARNLSRFTQILSQSGINSKQSYRLWLKNPENMATMAELFDYKREEGMPEIGSLINISFHPRLPLALYNYSKVAHNTLVDFPDGWTDTVRLCRGSVFELGTGKVVAIAYPKFFNLGEHPETSVVPNLPFIATDKKDGHLIIIFEYNGEIIATTRGEFTFISGQIAAQIIQNQNWQNIYPENLVLLAELIHPETKVHLDYSWQGLCLTGAIDRNNFHDLDYSELETIGHLLNLPVTEKWEGDSVGNLIALMKDRSVDNKEGFVIRFEDGVRMKIKYETYIGKMVEAKLTNQPYLYIIGCYLSGRLEKMMSTLPEEVFDKARLLMGDIFYKMSIKGNAKIKWRNLYTLIPDTERSSYFEARCRLFAKTITGEL